MQRSENMAAVCHFWNSTIFAPGEKESCSIGTLYSVDLENRVLYLGTPDARQSRAEDQRLGQQVTARDLIKGGGLEKLEGMRSALLAQQELERKRVEAENSRQKYINDLTTSQTVAGLEKAIAQYKNNDPDGLVHGAQKRLKDLKDRDAQQAKVRSEENQKRQQAAEANREAYVALLHKKYFKNLIPSSSKALDLVINFSIDCRAPDGRYLPLVNVLYASAASAEKMGGELRYIIENKREQVRIYDVAYKDGKQLTSPILRFEINEWGELRPYGITVEAIRNSCFGSYGPIWEYRWQ